MLMHTKDDKLVVIQEFNENHDKLGRFSAGRGTYVDHGDISGGEFAKIAQLYEDHGLTPGQEDAVNKYAGSYYHEINKELRSNKIDKQADLIRNLDGAMTMELKENTIVYRGMQLDGILEPGDILHDKGYVSTSMRKFIGLGYTPSRAVPRNGTITAYLVKMKLPKGTKGVMPLAVNLDAIAGEAEWILPRNGSFHVVSSTHHQVENYTEVEVEYEP